MEVRITETRGIFAPDKIWTGAADYLENIPLLPVFYYAFKPLWQRSAKRQQKLELRRLATSRGGNCGISIKCFRDGYDKKTFAIKEVKLFEKRILWLGLGLEVIHV